MNISLINEEAEYKPVFFQSLQAYSPSLLIQLLPTPEFDLLEEAAWVERVYIPQDALVVPAVVEGQHVPLSPQCQLELAFCFSALDGNRRESVRLLLSNKSITYHST